MTVEICARCGGTGAYGTCSDCEGTGSIDRVELGEFVTPQPSLVRDPSGFVPRPNFCSGRFWRGGVSSQCYAQALPGESCCASCKAHEKKLAERRRQDVAAAAEVKGRRRHG